MKKYSKGLHTRLDILEKARKILNDKGIWITQDMLTQEMGLSKSRVTNHFPTKESLFKAILAEYEMEILSIVKQIQPRPETASFTDLAKSLSRVMDIQYEYRCGISYISLVNPGQKEVFEEIGARYKKNLESIRYRIQFMIDKDLLLPVLLTPEKFSIFTTQYIHFLSTWIFNLDLYHHKEGYRKMKPIYLQTALSSFMPYVTKKGLKEMESISSKKMASSRF